MTPNYSDLPKLPLPATNESGYLFIAENSSDVICRAGPDSLLLYISPSSYHVLGWQPDEMVGKRLDAFVYPEPNVGADETPPAAPPLASHDSLSTIPVRRKDGLVVWLECKHRPVHHPTTGELIETIIVLRNVTEIRALQTKLSALDLIDSPTGLFTRPAFDEAIKREWTRAHRAGSRISLLLLHFNEFKRFHDGYSHLEGDTCLTNAAAAIHSVLRLTDVAARYGAEDVAIILPATSPGGAAKVAAKIQLAMQPLRSVLNQKPEGLDRGLVSIGISTVLAYSNGTSRMPEILVLGAVSALERAKRLNTQAWRRDS